MCVRPAIRVRPDVCVWPGKTRLASKGRRQQSAVAFGQQSAFHQQSASPSVLLFFITASYMDAFL
jgi:hypothetical protein